MQSKVQVSDGLNAMNSKSYYLVFDIDGTLLNKEKRISKKTKKTFNRLHKTGYFYFALASSRMPLSIFSISKELQVSCDAIAYDGAIVVSKKANGGLDTKMVSHLNPRSLEILGTPEVMSAEYLGVYSGDLWFANKDSKWLQREESNTSCKANVLNGNFDERFRVEIRKPIHKVMIRDEAEKIQEIRNMISHSEFIADNVYSNGETILEITCKDVNKGHGISLLQKEKELISERIYVFGDGMNDLPMFDAFSNSVAVGNANERLKKIARYHTDDGDDDGVASFLIKHFRAYLF